MDLLVKNKFDELYNLAKSKNYDEKSLQMLEKGFLYANEKHKDQKRKSGEPYIIHPLSTAILLVEWNMDIETVVGGLLHDVIEDCEVDENEMVNIFGESIVSLVKYVTKVSAISKKTRKEIEEEKKIETGITRDDSYTIQVFLSMSNDLRAMIIKLADRLHNMRTIGALPYEKQVRIANETFAIYANIAGRLGMYDIKTELLDRSFEVINPKDYNDVKNKILKMKAANDSKWKNMNTKIASLLEINNLQFQLKTRIKGIYSTYRKLQHGIELKDIHDIFATRIIVNNPIQCYHVLGLIHLNFMYLKGAFKDYISQPKVNLYQSIHTTLVMNNTLFEIQIRDERMDTFAKFGVASHWKYKEKPNNEILAQATNGLIRDFNNSKDRSVTDIKEISTSKIFDVLLLNNNQWYVVSDTSTIIDVAYRYDPKLLPYLMNAYLNGMKTTFDQKLASGDTIKLVYTDTYPMIKSSWINAATSHVAKTFIKDCLEKNMANKPVLEKFLEEVNNSLGVNKANDAEIYKRLEQEFNFKTMNQWWDLVMTCKNLNDLDTKNHFINFFSTNKEKYLAAVKWIKSNAASWVMGSSYFKPIQNIYFNKLAFPECCVKLPGMEVIGVLKSGVLSVHNANCPKAKLKSSKRVVMCWDEDALMNHPRKFYAKILIEGPWTETVGNQIAKVIDNKRANLASLNINKIKNNMTYQGTIIGYFRDLNHLNSIMMTLETDDIVTKYQLL